MRRNQWKTSPALTFWAGCLAVGCAALGCQAVGCQRTEEAPPSGPNDRVSQQSQATPDARVSGPSHPAQPSVEPPDEAPWAGLRVRHAGVPLQEAERAMILIHGYGANAADLMEVGAMLSSQQHTAIVFPQGPLTLPQGGYAWFLFDGTRFQESVEQLRRLLRYVERERPGMPYVLGGFSQGAILTSNLLASASDRLQAALLFSPKAELLHRPAPSAPRVPLFMSHGTTDRVLPFVGGEQLRDTLSSLGYSVQWRPFTGGHTIPDAVVQEAQVFLTEHGFGGDAPQTAE